MVAHPRPHTTFPRLDHRLPSRRAPGYEARRALIRAQAAALFAAQGYQRASLSGLAHSLGVTTKGVTNYYEGKPALLFAVLEAHLRALLGAVEAAADETLPPFARLEALARGHLAFITGPGAAGHLLLREAARFLPEPRVLDLHTRERWLVALFRDALAATLMAREDDLAGDATGDDADKAARGAGAPLGALTLSLLAMLNEAPQWHQPEGALSLDAYASLAVRATLAAGGAQQ